MDKDVLKSYETLATWQPTVEPTPPNKQERAEQFARWCQEYEGIVVGEYPETKLGIITVTVADATFAYHTWEFPTVDLYVKIALAINTGNLKEREGLTWKKYSDMVDKYQRLYNAC